MTRFSLFIVAEIPAVHEARLVVRRRASGDAWHLSERVWPNRAPAASNAQKQLEAFGSAFWRVSNRCIERSRSRLLPTRDLRGYALAAAGGGVWGTRARVNHCNGSNRFASKAP